MREAVVLNRIKIGERIPKPAIRVKTTTPEGWNPGDIKSYAQAAMAWRNR
jgi:hypothetical protein